MYPLAPLLTWSRRFFSSLGLTPAVGLFTHAVLAAIGERAGQAAFHPRRQVEHLVREGVGYGLLSDEQSAIVQRVLTLASRRVRDEMVPWDEVLVVQ
ncbi:MAG TPA: hypothetical protein VK991_10875, partial [Halomonas sp.]|nr:hypothetical protein [Halomonas sp.]